MIKAAELRIGNWLGSRWISTPERVDYFQVVSITKDEDWSMIEPIRLMPELLEKIGFEKVNKSEYWLNYQAHNKAFLSLCLQDDSGGNYKKGVWYFTAADIELSYLHELQNAWFVFFKKELAIKFD